MSPIVACNKRLYIHLTLFNPQFELLTLLRIIQTKWSSMFSGRIKRKVKERSIRRREFIENLITWDNIRKLLGSEKRYIMNTW